MSATPQATGGDGNLGPDPELRDVIALQNWKSPHSRPTPYDYWMGALSWERSRIASALSAQSAELEALKAQLAALTAERDELRKDLAAARAEAERAALWAAHLKLHLGELQRKVADFVRGASPAEWRHKEPRIVGFGLEFEEMKRFAALKDPEPPAALSAAIDAAPTPRDGEREISAELHRRFCSDVPNDGTYTLNLNETETIRFFAELDRLEASHVAQRVAEAVAEAEQEITERFNERKFWVEETESLTPKLAGIKLRNAEQATAALEAENRALREALMQLSRELELGPVGEDIVHSALAPKEGK